MRTRRGLAYSAAPSAHISDRPSKRARLCLRPTDCDAASSSSVLDPSVDDNTLHNPFDSLPDDLLLSIFVCISASASSPSDLLVAKRTCKKFSAMAKHPMVLEKASLEALQISADKWDEGAKAYLQSCAEAGNAEACYTLGMIRFYCLTEREQGIMLMTKAARAAHPSALHSLAVIQFNGSGGARKHKNLKAGVSLCARAAAGGHIDAMRELGHCLQDGYGIAKNVLEGRRLLLEANAREVAAAVGRGGATAIRRCSAAAAAQASQEQPKSATAAGCLRRHHLLCAAAAETPRQSTAAQSMAAIPDRSAAAAAAATTLLPLYKVLHHSGSCSSLLSDFGCTVPLPELHPCHSFLVRWFSALHPPSSGLRLCSHHHCGRPETRRHEFRRCSACGNVNYCSRACQALDWKLRHKFVCVPAANWQNNNGRVGEAAAAAAVAEAAAAGGNPEAAVAENAHQQQNAENNHFAEANEQQNHDIRQHIHHQQQLPPPPPAAAAAADAHQNNLHPHHQNQTQLHIHHHHHLHHHLLPLHQHHHIHHHQPDDLSAAHNHLTHHHHHLHHRRRPHLLLHHHHHHHHLVHDLPAHNANL